MASVEFYALLRPIAGSRTVQFDLPDGASTRVLLTAIVERFPAMRSHLLDDEGFLRSETPVFVDGRNPRLAAAGLDEPFPAGGVLSLFSPIASGKMNVARLRVEKTGDKP